MNIIIKSDLQMLQTQKAVHTVNELFTYEDNHNKSRLTYTNTPKTVEIPNE